MTVVDAAAKTFSESWHRVSSMRAALRPSVEAHRQEFRGQLWVVLNDPLNNHFFRISAEAYDFVARLRPNRTVAEVWQETLERDPDQALSQEEVVQLLAQLNLANLLFLDRPGQSASLFERYRKRRQREARARWLSFIAVRIPLVDPDRLLTHCLPLIRLLFGPVGLLLWLGLVGLAAKLAIDNADKLVDQAQGVLAPDNLVLLYLGFLIAKLIHEFSHAAACKRFGGEVHVMGVMLLVFTPLPFVDATTSWGFRQRWQRILVGAAGMLAEFMVAALAVVVWSHAAPGTIHALAYNIIFAATVSTLAFNLNPLLRFDGYYILVDLIDLPNLYQRSREQLKYTAERRLFGMPGQRPPARTGAEAFTLGLYGVLSLGYWVVIAVGILSVIADQYLDLGIALAILLGFLWGVMPVVMFLRFLAFSPRLGQQRTRAVLVVLTLVAVVVGPLALLPVPDRVRVPGVVEGVAIRQVANLTDGFVTKILVPGGGQVTAGQPLLHLENPDLDWQIAATRAQREELLVEERRAEGGAIADLAPLRENRAALEATLAELLRRRETLTVTAPVAGTWTTEALASDIGRWLPRGSALGMIINEDAHRFVAVVPQVATHLFDGAIRTAEVRLAGQEDVNLVAATVQVIPFQHGLLPSAALGWLGGGDIAVSMTEGGGRMAVEPFFRIHAAFDADAAERARLGHGRSGTMRVTLRDQPLLWQWERQVRQFLQRQYRL